MIKALGTLVGLSMVAIMVMPSPAFGVTFVGFRYQDTRPDNPDGSFNVGTTIHLSVEPDFCDTVRVNWGDGTVTTARVQPNSILAFVSHAYSKGGTYRVTASETCRGGGPDGYLAIRVGGWGLDVNVDPTLVGTMGVLLGLLAIGLGAAGPSIKTPPSPPPAPVGERDQEIDIDKKVPFLKDPKEVEEQQRFFENQQRHGDLKPGSKVYLSSFHETPHRIMDDPLTKYTVGPYLKMMDSGLDVIKSAMISTTDAMKGVLIPHDTNTGGQMPKVKYDPDADKYYYDFHDTVSGKEAVTEFAKSSFEVSSQQAPHYLFKGARSLYLESLGAPATPHTPLPLEFNIFDYYDPAPVVRNTVFGGWIKGPNGLEWLQRYRLWG